MQWSCQPIGLSQKLLQFWCKEIQQFFWRISHIRGQTVRFVWWKLIIHQPGLLLWFTTNRPYATYFSLIINQISAAKTHTHTHTQKGKHLTRMEYSCRTNWYLPNFLSPPCSWFSRKGLLCKGIPSWRHPIFDWTFPKRIGIYNSHHCLPAQKFLFWIVY